MGLSCGMSMVKYGLFIFNFVCAIAGIALIVVGAIPLTKLDDIRDVFVQDNPAIVPTIVLVLGSVIFIISFFGCCGAIKESQCMVTTYAFFLLVLVIVQIVIAVYAFMYTEDLATAAKKGFASIWNQLSNDPKGQDGVNRIQSALHCCGNVGPADYIAALRPIPPSCCPGNSNSCSVISADLFSQGCGAALYELVNSSGILIAYIAIVFGAFELVGVVFACCLANSIRNTTRRQYH